MNQEQTITIHPLNKFSRHRLVELAMLHERVLPTLLISQLGLYFVERYYQAAVRDPRVIGFYAANDQTGDLCGFVVGTPQPNALIARLRRPLGCFVMRTVCLLRQRPHLLRQLVISARSAGGQMEGETNAVELTYLGVAPEQRGQGLGSRLLQAFLYASRSAGYRKVVLSVETDNTAAIRLYQKAGFVICKTFREGRFERHRMEVVL